MVWISSINEIVARWNLYFLFRCKEKFIKKGTVKWFSADKGYGFIVPEDGSKDLFVHHSEIKSDGEFSTLSDGQSVEFEVGEGPKGPCAVNVQAV